VRQIENATIGPYTDFQLNANETLIKGSQGISNIMSQKITVTTTPKMQEYIGQLIGLIEQALGKAVPREQKSSTKGRRGKIRKSDNHQKSQKLGPEPDN
jgi:hypothetical protein